MLHAALGAECDFIGELHQPGINLVDVPYLEPLRSVQAEQPRFPFAEAFDRVPRLHTRPGANSDETKALRTVVRTRDGLVGYQTAIAAGGW